jgi:3',5'-cyclic AMP phosphodiesterase CpdA
MKKIGTFLTCVSFEGGKMITKIEFEGVKLSESRIVLHAGLKRKHVFAQLTDTHLAVCDGKNDELANARSEFWAIQGGVFRGEERVYPNELSELICRRLRELSPEAVIFTGDTVDYPSAANFRRAKSLFDSIGANVIFVPGNHDEVGEDADEDTKKALLELTGGVKDVEVKALTPELDAIVIDDKHVRVTEAQVAKVRDALDRIAAEGKKALVFAHAPFLTASATWVTRRTWGFTWMVGEDANGEEGKELVRLLNERKDVIIGIFAGHIHRESGDGEGARHGEQYDPNEVRQFTAAPALCGFYRIIEID